MPRKRQTSTNEQTPARQPTPTLLLELPLQVTPRQAKRLRAHLEAARQVYTALLSEGQRRLRRMRADPAWQVARAIPRGQKQERQRACAALRKQYGFAEYALHEEAKGLNCSWIADHVDAVLAREPGQSRLSRPQSLPGSPVPPIGGAGRPRPTASMPSHSPGSWLPRPHSRSRR